MWICISLCKCMACIYRCPQRSEECIESVGWQKLGTYHIGRWKPKQVSLQKQWTLFTSEPFPTWANLKVQRGQASARGGTRGLQFVCNAVNLSLWGHFWYWKSPTSVLFLTSIISPLFSFWALCNVSCWDSIQLSLQVSKVPKENLWLCSLTIGKSLPPRVKWLKIKDTCPRAPSRTKCQGNL